MKVKLILIVVALVVSCKQQEIKEIEPTPTAPVSDIDGNEYATIQIGTQVWMAENLNVSKFRNGDPIPEANTDAEWEEATDNNQPAWCYYDNDPANGAKYGKLYNWYAVNDPRGLAPVGWHVPTEAEWTVLTEFLGDGAGDKMRSPGSQYWTSPNSDANNSSGFSGLPGGMCSGGGGFQYVGQSGAWWSSTEYYTDFAAIFILDFLGGAHLDDSYMAAGGSVRCVRD